MTFDATLTMCFTVIADTESFTLYAESLKFDKIELFDSEMVNLTIRNTTIERRLSHIVIVPEARPQVGASYYLRFVYTGTINKPGEDGMFYTSFVNEQGENE
jgi:hypothetical protein